MAKRFIVVCLDGYQERWTPAQRLLFFELCRLATFKEREVNGVCLTEGQLLITSRELVELLGTSMDTAQKTLAALNEAGVIKCEKVRIKTLKRGSPITTLVTIMYGKANVSEIEQELTNCKAVKKTVKIPVKKTVKKTVKIEPCNILQDNELGGVATDGAVKKTVKKTVVTSVKKIGKYPCNTLEINNLQPLNNVYNNKDNNNTVVDICAQEQKKSDGECTEQCQQSAPPADIPKNASELPNLSDYGYDPIIIPTEFENLIKTSLDQNPRFGLLVYKTGIMPSRAPEFIDEFVALCEVKGENHRGKRDVLMHFVNFLRKKSEALRREEKQNELDKLKLQKYGNYQQQETARFESAQRELIGDMLGINGCGGGDFRPNTAYCQPSGIGTDNGDVLELPPI